MTISKFMSADEKKQVDVVSVLMRAIELANERGHITAVVILQDKDGNSDTLGTPINNFYSFLGAYTQLEFKLRQGAES